MLKDEKLVSFFLSCEATIQTLFTRCLEKKPQYSVTYEQFRERVEKTIYKYLIADNKDLPSIEETKNFIQALFAEDLYLALACANGDEQAWWDFDKEYRVYLERLANSMTRIQSDAEEAICNLYNDLFGTSIQEGRRNSKFISYSGRGSLRAWLKTIIWHSIVDLHRASEDLISFEEIIEQLGEGYAHITIKKADTEVETKIVDRMTTEKYLKLALFAMDQAFNQLEDYEKLLLFYYYVENLKLREIARLVELPSSPLRNWVRRHSEKRTRIHESTIMRWLEKTYLKLLNLFQLELRRTENLKPSEIEACLNVIVNELPSLSLKEKLRVLDEG